MAQGTEAAASRGGWGKAPASPEGESPLGARETRNGDDASASDRARVIAEEVGGAIRSGLAPVADRMGAAMRTGVEGMGRALEDPGGALASELLKQSDLPELEGGDPLLS